jgi:hypothetical protein
MSVKTLYPTTQPSLLLDFANVKQLDPRVTFVRTTTATYYNGVTTAKAEENLLLRSQEFDNAYWGKTRSTVTANTDTAPDGTATADSFLQESGQTLSGVLVSASNSYTANIFVVSVFAKPNGKDFIRLAFLDATAGNVLRDCYFNVSTGTIGTASNGAVGSIVASTNGYYRCSIAYTFSGSGTFNCRFFIADSDNSTVVVDSGGLYIWGAQLEQRSAVTAYTPTTTQPITNYIPVLLTAPAGVARFDHNPTTGESLGLLIEEQRTNLWLRSEEFDNATWVKDSCTVLANATISPDGTLTADRFVPNAGALANSRLRQGFAYTAQQFTYTVYAKKDGNFLYYATASAAVFNPVPSVYVDLTDGSVLQSSNATTTVTSVGNGWYRISIKPNANAVSGTSSFGILHGAADAVGSSAVTGNGYSGIYIWGAQLEEGAVPTSYIPTVASSVTRNADAASMTGVNFSSWYRADEGSIYAEINSALVNTTTQHAWYVSNSTGADRFVLRRISSGLVGTAFVVNSVSQGDMFFGTAIPGGSTYKAAVAYNFNDLSLVVNASSAITDTSASIPVVDRMFIGSNITSEQCANGHIRKLAYYPTRLTNAQLQALTS